MSSPRQILFNGLCLRAYRKFRATGDSAVSALRSARTLVRFEALGEDLVRIRCEDEQENYFDVYGREDNPRDQKRMEETIDRMGCVCVISEYYDGAEWQRADSVGMCVYDRPESPFENCYVVDLMQAAIDALPEQDGDSLVLALGDTEDET